jgi:O-antigen/teichoic acid export membrane protein
MGIGFAGANLLLARTLSTTSYALVTLVVTLMNVSVPLAPAGLDGMVNRRAIDIGVRLLCYTLFTSTLVGLATVVAGRSLYGLDASLLLLLFLGIVAGGATLVAAATFQSAQRFTLSVLLNQSANLFHIIAAVAAVVFGIQQAWLPLGIIAAGYFLTAGWSWSKLSGEPSVQLQSVQRFRWDDALYYAGVNAVGFILLQLDRLLIPKFLTLEDLAIFGVLTAVVVAPFRSLQMGVGFALLPQLRAAKTVAARRRLLAKEGAVVAFVLCIGSVAIWYLTPRIVDWFLAGKYSLPPVLVLAALIVGILKVMSTLARATVTAFCSTQELAYLNVLSWLSVVGAIAGGMFGARWGLTGVIYGVGFGWVGRGLASAYFALPYFREPSRMVSAPAEEPEL